MRPIFGKRKIKMLGVNVFLLMLMSVCVDINTDETIHLSKKSGFYEDSFYLEIEGKRGRPKAGDVGWGPECKLPAKRKRVGKGGTDRSV